MVRCVLECPRLWRITKHSLHNEGTYKWVNSAPIFFDSNYLRFSAVCTKSEFLKLIILFFPYFWQQNLNQCHKLSWKNTHIYFFYFWFKNKRVWAEKIRNKEKKKKIWKILVSNLLIYIYLHCVKSVLWCATTLATLINVPIPWTLNT